jgi:hypothetical protein
MCVMQALFLHMHICSVEGAREGEQGVLRDVQQGPRGAEHGGGDNGTDREDALRTSRCLQDRRRRKGLAIYISVHAWPSSS